VETDAKVIIFRETLATPALFLLKKAPKRNLFHIIPCILIELRPKLLTKEKQKL
jgi:hypothetical protein